MTLKGILCLSTIVALEEQERKSDRDQVAENEMDIESGKFENIRFASNSVHRYIQHFINTFNEERMNRGSRIRKEGKIIF